MTSFRVLILAVLCYVTAAVSNNDKKEENLVREKRQGSWYDIYNEERQMYEDQQRKMQEEREAAIQEYQQQQRDEAERRFQEEMDAMYGSRVRREVGSSKSRQKRQYSGVYDNFGAQSGFGSQPYGYGGISYPSSQGYGAGGYGSGGYSSGGYGTGGYGVGYGNGGYRTDPNTIYSGGYGR